jgi:hypothetical protein
MVTQHETATGHWAYDVKDMMMMMMMMMMTT